jgi:hypothetical protein
MGVEALLNLAKELIEQNPRSLHADFIDNYLRFQIVETNEKFLKEV